MKSTRYTLRDAAADICAAVATGSTAARLARGEYLSCIDDSAGELARRSAHRAIRALSFLDDRKVGFEVSR